MPDLLLNNNISQASLTSQISTSMAFVPKHRFVCINSGSIKIFSGNKEYNRQSGDYFLIKRNTLVKFVPSLEGESSLTEIQLGPDFLKGFSDEYTYTAKRRVKEDSIINIKSDPMLHKYLESRLLYENLKGKQRDDLLILKDKELIFLLLNLDPDLQHILFNFDEPEKVDVKDYMNHNYKYNLSLSQFGYLTGRSLTSFKRDFEKVFNEAPGRWLLDKRLNEARILIEQEGRKPTDVYLEIGFEDLSHFSFAFKKAFGASPKKLSKRIETS